MDIRYSTHISGQGNTTKSTKAIKEKIIKNNNKQAKLQ